MTSFLTTCIPLLISYTLLGLTTGVVVTRWILWDSLKEADWHPGERDIWTVLLSVVFWPFAITVLLLMVLALLIIHLTRYLFGE